MALSSDEHTLLVNTCDNMNVAAETCRQVLDMLRSLGASGVVDIATHNTAATVHAEAENLVHYSASRGGYVGVLASQYSGMYNVELHPSGQLCGVSVASDGVGNSTTDVPGVRFYRAFSNSNGELLDISSATQGSLFGVLGSSCKFLDGQTTKTCSATIKFDAGVSGDLTNWKKTRITFTVANGTAAAQVLDVDSTRLMPPVGGGVSLGDSTHRFGTAYLASSPDVSSDMRIKEDVRAFDSSAVDFVKQLRPVQFRYAANGAYVTEADEQGNPIAIEKTPGVRTHWGFIAQEVKQAMTTAGIEDAAVWCLADKEDPDSMQSLRYEELIAPLVQAVQVLAAKIEVLEAR